MGTLFEGFQILCTDYDYILGKRRIVFKGGHYIRKDIIQRHTVGILKRLGKVSNTKLHNQTDVMIPNNAKGYGSANASLSVEVCVAQWFSI